MQKNIDGFLCCRIREEPPEIEDDGDFINESSSVFDFPEELADFLRGLNGKKQR